MVRAEKWRNYHLERQAISLEVAHDLPSGSQTTLKKE